ncbi:Type III export protein PscG [compost metagenome]
MDQSLNNALAHLATLGIEHHRHVEALLIADWLDKVEQQAEAACLIRLCSLMGKGQCQEALIQGAKWGLPSLSPWLALCEWRLGLGAALDRRMAELESSDDPHHVRFAAGMRQAVAS